MPKTFARRFALAASSLLIACLALSWAWPRVSTASTTGQKEKPAGKAVSKTTAPAANASVTSAKVSGNLSLSRLLDDDGNGDHFTVDLRSRLETRLTNYNAHGSISGYTPVRLSPDGLKVVYAAPVRCVEGGCFGREIFVADADGSNQVNVTNHEPYYDGEPAWSPDGEHIVFVRALDEGHRELYVMEADGSNLQRLPSRPIRAGTPSIFPSWSPDGSKIAYPFASGLRQDIAVLRVEQDANGKFIVTSDVQLTSTPEDESTPVWSPDGAKIAFERLLSGNDGKYEIFVMNADGSNQVNLTNTPDNGEFCPVWSPDGWKIAFTKILDATAPNNKGGENGLFVMNADGTNPTRVEMSGYGNYAWSWIDPCTALPPPQSNVTAWSATPNGKAEGHVARPGSSHACTQSGTSAASSQSGESSPGANASAAASSLRGALTLFGYDASGRAYISTFDLKSSLETVLRNPGQNGRNSQSKPRFSPDGSKIAFAEAGDGFNIDVYVMDADGSNVVNLSNYPADPGEAFNCRFANPATGVRGVSRCLDTSPAWSPDGQHIAFISGRNGRDELYVMNADGTNLQHLPSRMGAAQNHEAGFYGQPSWSPDGAQIVYSHPTDYPPFFDAHAGQTEIAVLALSRQEGPGGNETFSVNSDVQLTNTATPLFDLAPAWSPDGSMIAFHRYDPSLIPHGNSNSDLYVMKADGTNQVNLSNTTDRHETLPVWSPDGSKLAFTLEPFDQGCRNGCFDIGPTQLTILDLNTSSLTRIETLHPTVNGYSWIDPCAAPPLSGATKASASQSKPAVPVKASKSDGVAALAAFKCIKEIVVNVTTDDPDTDTTDEFCDTDDNDPGNQCSLRAAIEEANARPGQDFITFDIPGDGLHTIAPTSELPDITEQVAIDATTEPGYADNAPVVELSGAQAGAANGFNVKAEGVRIAGLVINRFAKNGVTDKGNGVFAPDTTGLFLHSCFIGTDANGMAAAPNDVGVLLRNTTDSTIGGDLDSFGNLISGNKFGVSILGTESVPRGGNSVVGNRIGVDRTGANALGNETAGVIVIASTHNQIGGDTDAPGAAPGNVIAGNNPTGGAGVALFGAKNTTVAGNLIGTDAAGTKGLGNAVGVSLSMGATDNTIGGDSAQARNVISGNKFGVDLFGPGVNENLVLNNYVGTDITGGAIVPIAGVPDFPQQRRGITIEGGSRNQIGNGSDTRNVVAGNAEVQIGILRPEATGNQVAGNYVGLFADGNTNPTYDPREIGIWILDATKTTVGDTFSDARNVVSGNGLGILVANPDNSLSAQNKLLYNYIGTNAAGTAARPNASGGVLITKSSNNLVEGNVISGNNGAGGIALANELGQQNSSAATAGSKSFAAAYPANAAKISASSALSAAVALLHERGATAARQDKGGSVAQAVETAETKNNVVQENYIGTSVDGQTAIPNATAGVFIGPGANENIIGEAGSGNIISGNSGAGVLIGNSEQSAASPTANKIQGNIIGLNADATAKVPNIKQGVGVLFGAGTIIGGDTEDAGNVIAGNRESGVAIIGTSNTVRFNFIGTNREGVPDLGNAGDGIKLENVTDQENIVANNSIGGNGGVGVNVLGSSGQTPPPAPSAAKMAGIRPRDIVGKLTKIAGGNLIGIVKVVNGQNTVGVKLANALGGLKISDTFNVAVSNQAGNGPNIIAGNNGPGVLIEGQASTGNIVEGAIIGTNEEGASGLGNAGDGVRIVNAPANFVGGENAPGAARLGNVIAGNAGNGISIEGGNAGGNAVQGNLVGVVNANGSISKNGNGLIGIKIDSAAGTLVGLLPGLGGAVKENLGNIIGGNSLGGLMLQSASATRISGNAIGTDHNNTTNLGNVGPGVLMTSGTNGTIVGGPEEGSGNRITDNGGSGVRIDETAGEGNLVDPNSIFNNRAYGIDLGRRGHTPNDFGDADAGPNRLQNYPEITAREVNADGQLVVSYRLTSAPGNSNYGTAGIYVEFFKADPSGEGERFLGFTHYTEADYNNGAPVVKQVNLGSVAALGINPDDPITATASDASNNTSEFSPPYSSRVLIVTKTDDTNDGDCDGDCSLREALADANAGDRIEFASSLFDAAQTITLGGSELLVNKSVTVKGKGAHLLTVSGNNLSRVFNVTDGATPTLSGLTITKGNAGGAFIGGGILNAGTLTLVESHVTDNIADRGAGLYNTETLIVRASTVSDNKANLGSATPAGGGIQNAGGGSLEVINSTVSGNSATVSDGAGGIYIADGTATITGSTIANNSAPQGASNAGGIKNKDGVVTLRGSIVALNTAASPDAVGVFTSGGYNLIGKHDGAAASLPVGGPNPNNDLVGTSAAAVDPRLDALADYGGTTPTHQLQADSPAIDKGLAFGETKDQRGLTRPSDDSATPNAAGGDGSDIGAYEAQFAPPSSASLAGRITFGGSPLSGVTVTLMRPDGTTSTTLTDASGFYNFTNLVGGNYTVTPTRDRFTFTPASRPVMMSGTDITGLDFEATSTLSNPQPANGTVIISEFRFSGATTDDEYVELYNNTDASLNISGYILETAGGQTLIVPPNTTLPARGHYLFAHGTGYTLMGYAQADQPYTAFDLSGNAGLVLLNASDVIIDAVGLGSPPPPYHEGATPAPVSDAGQYAFTRKLSGGMPQDTGVNAADFQLVSTDGGNYGGVGSQLGAPGPEGLSSPVQRNAIVKPMLIDPTAAATAPPNRVRSSFGANPTNAAFGTLSIQRRFKNASNEPVRRLRFRIVDLTTLGSPVSSAPQADLRVLSSTGTVRNSQNQVVATVNGLTLETPPTQGLGGGVNSTLTVALPGGMLAGGSSIDVQFLLGVQGEGNFRFFVNVEALTDAPTTMSGATKAARGGKQER